VQYKLKCFAAACAGFDNGKSVGRWHRVVVHECY
jgi:hypothetical protein